MSIRKLYTSQLSQIQRTLTRTMATQDGYLHKTLIPTYHFQQSLPSLPIPEVKDTLDRFLASAEPLVSPSELQEAQDAVQDFLLNHSDSLQTQLVAKDKIEKSSFVTAPWYEMYLQDRRPLIVNSNPAVGWKEDPNRTTQLSRASSLLHAAAVTYRTLRDEQLEPDIFHTEPKKSETGWWANAIRFVPPSISFYGAYAVGAYPLDMSQYDYLFASTRVPGATEDTLKKYKNSKHVCVMRGSKFYSINILNDNGDLLPETEISHQLQLILNETVDTTTPPVGTLTALDRDTWSGARTQMLSIGDGSVNEKAFHAIDSSLFVLCLEDKMSTTHEERFRSNVHGDGKNRWFDKSFSIIVDPDGGAAVNFEHAWGDGVAVIRFFNEVYKESMGSEVLSGDGDGEDSVVLNEIQFELDDDITTTIRKGKYKYKKRMVHRVYGKALADLIFYYSIFFQLVIFVNHLVSFLF